MARVVEQLDCGTGCPPVAVLNGRSDAPARDDVSPLLAAEELDRVVRRLNETDRDFPRNRSLHQLIEQQVERTPQAVAVVFEGQQLTYADLNRRADQLASYLRKRDVRPGDLVALCVERSPEMVVGLLGILKAGGAYVPLDPAYPSERLAFMLADSAARVLLTQRRLVAGLPTARPPVICLDTDWNDISREHGENLTASLQPDSLAYVIYTSGSTGRPKGVQIPHRAVVNFLYSMRRQPGISADDRLLSVTTLSFDIAGLELFLPLTVGARVVLISREVAADGAQLAAALSRTEATLMQATPATWQLLLATGWQGDSRLTALCGGEALPRALADNLVGKCATLWNMYGPTETTIWSTLHRIEPNCESILIGRPIDNTQVYIVDGQTRPVPVGVAGELLIGGDGLARGYWGRPALTAEKFIPDPFGALPGGRLYKTGDLARLLPDGAIECLGRIDHQVKIRGFRIELGEIETVLGRHPAVRETVVVAREDTPGDKRLVAYVVGVTGQSPPVSEIRQFLKEKLADYMVPAAFVVLDSLPRTPNGKIDRRALPAPGPDRPDLGRDYCPPRHDIEKRLVAMWEEALGIRPIGIRDNIFDLGAHSLVVAQVAMRIQGEFGTDESVAVMLQAPTIERFATRLRQKEPASSWTSLVPLRVGGSGAPFFCVPGAGGTLYLLRQLASALGGDRPVYGLQSRVWHGNAEPHTDVEEMARHYVQEIRTVQAAGPYLLGGYCFGGIVAYEMARQLRELGEEVALVAALNAPNPAATSRSHPPIGVGEGPAPTNSRPPERRRTPKRESSRATRIAHKIGDGVRWRSRLWTSRARWTLTGLRIRAHLALGIPMPPALRFLHLVRVCQRAEQRYVPRAAPVRVAVFRSDLYYLDPYLGKDPGLGWGELVDGNLEIHEIPSAGKDRRELLDEPNVHHVAVRLRDCLARAEAECAPARTGAAGASNDLSSQLELNGR